MQFTDKILILDGAMGTSIQKRGLAEEDFKGAELAEHTMFLNGNNDILNITRPELIKEIHREYIAAGAEIITTNTFNSNALSQADYGCEHLVRKMARRGAEIARQAADEANGLTRGSVNPQQPSKSGTRVWVAGSVGPTSKTLSLSPNGEQPEQRDTDFATMADAYQEQIEGLIEGGVDTLLIETIFDGLNAKAAIWAALEAQRELGKEIPIMLSATVNDRSGRTLTGQSMQALYTALEHAQPISFGLNCSFGARELMPFVEQVAAWVPCAVSVYPNAGLPNEMGGYDETPADTASQLREMAKKGLLNIAGGCCGTTTEHIKAVAEALRGLPPRALGTGRSELIVSGLDAVIIDPSRNFTNIGERTNVAGSAVFRKLVEAQNWDEAAAVARRQIEGGASIIDVNMDDAMIDGAASMTTFLRHIATDPEVAKAAVMIDSSEWETIQKGLRNVAGKPIVNSISLKEGAEKFLEHANEIRRLGAAVVVMAFDEKGQADTRDRKTEIAARAYKLLTDNGFTPQDIIFDVNVLAVGTGIDEHANYGVDFIEAVRWIKANLPGARTSAGVSNLSFSFRGNNPVREAMHSVFLYHAIAAGLDMAIVNPAMLQIYDQIDPVLLQAVEDVVLNRRPDATERLVEVAGAFKKDAAATAQKEEQWRTLPIEERLAAALQRGVHEYMSVDLQEALKLLTPVQIIEGPLMRGMERVGELFGEGKMFLPQVVKSARTMKEAVAVLQPLIAGSATAREHRMVLATVKGDVHDIGKNIVKIVLECNNIEVIDLGVMVPGEHIVAAALEHQPDFVGVSGLITPSLAEMESLCVAMRAAGLRMPLFVGGATTSSVHTAVKLAPLYDDLMAGAGSGVGGGLVVHGGDASRTVSIAKRLLRGFDDTAAEIRAEQASVRELYNETHRELTPFEEIGVRSEELGVNAKPAARQHHCEEPRGTKRDEAIQRNRVLLDCFAPNGASNDAIRRLGMTELNTPHPFLPTKIDWMPLLHFWGFRGTLDEMLKNPEAAKTLDTAQKMLAHIIEHNEFEVAANVQIFSAHQEGNDIILEAPGIANASTAGLTATSEQKGDIRLPMLRQQVEPFCSLADWAAPQVGLFCVKVEDKLPACNCEEFDHLMRQSLAARMAEACAALVQERTGATIRPAFGYPSCPDHSLKKEVVSILNAPVEVTEGYSLVPSTSVCGMLLFDPAAHYFDIRRIDRAQLADYASRRGIPTPAMEKLLNALL